VPKLDLNAARAARAAKRGEPMSIELGDPAQSFRLVDELPVEVTEKATAGDVVGAMKALLKDQEDWPKIQAIGLSYDDILAIVEFYGTSLGESQASAISSKMSTAQSKPTSSTTTASTLPTQSGAATPPTNAG